jgi:hypothetical protein
MHRHSFSIALALVLALVLSACTAGSREDGGADHSTGASSVQTPVETNTPASPTPPAIPEQPPATRGPVASDCVEGWETPETDTTRYRTPLRVIRRVTGEGRLDVVDMRWFDGPESPPSDKGYLLNVARWYVKAFAKDDQAFQGRFLVEQRTYGIGLVSVAPYDTNGFRSPDWTGFQFDAGDTQRMGYPGLPGTWSGAPYDFVDGGAGLQMPGLPSEVVGCLSGT